MSKFLNKDFLNKIITSVFFVWLLFTFVGTINDPNLTPWGLTHNVFRLSFFIFIIIFIYTKLFNYRKFLFFTFITIGIIYQLFLIFFLTNQLVETGDIAYVHDGIINFDSSRWYLKTYSNNFFIILFQNCIINLFHLNTSWLTVNIINLFCIDISFIINIIICKIINKKNVKNIIIIQIVLLFMLPHVITPYTDTMVLPFVSCYILGFVIFKNNFNENKFKLVIGLILLSFGSFFAYEMKPSTIVPILSILILSIVYYLKKSNFKNVLIYLIIFLSIFFGCIFAINNVRDNILKVDVSGNFPISHFAAMGIMNHGTWNLEATEPIINLKDKNKQKKISQDIIKNQLNNYGFLGFLQFLINKNYDNTSDGTFGWYRFDYYYIYKNPENLMQNIYYQNGKYFHDYQFVAQVFWIGMVGLLVIGTCRVDDITQLLRVGLMGGLFFLLIFEGGRSRYLIQFLPFIIILNAITLPYSIDLLKKIKKTIKENKY